MTMKNPPHPGLSVRHDCIEPLDLSITEAADILGVTRRALNNVVGIVNLASRGMLILSVARCLGSEGPLLAYCVARSNGAGPQKGALGSLS
jgi:plasmid maintenance system antidote protein VapI